MTDGINEKRPIFQIEGPSMDVWPILLSEMPICDTCYRSYIDAAPDEIFYRDSEEQLVWCCECLRKEGWKV